MQCEWTYQSLSPNDSDDESDEPAHSDPFLFTISDKESSAASPPQFLFDDEPMDVDEDMYFDNSHHDSGHSSSSPPIIPSGPGPSGQNQRSNGHQQTPGNEKLLKWFYHDKLTGRFNIISLLYSNNSDITSRSEM